MLEFDLEDVLDDVAPPARVVAGARCVGGRVKVQDKIQEKSQPEAGFAQTTLWMLAVRDARDKVAFGKLFDHFAPRLKGVLCRGGASPAQAEDVVQDVMLTVWRKAQMYDPSRAQVSAWIYQIARNRQIDLIRKDRKPLPEELKPVEVTEVDASQIVALEQETSALRLALQKLKPAQRDMVERAYLGEMSHQDIRAETGLPLGTIKSRIRLGLEKLRHELKRTEAK